MFFLPSKSRKRDKILRMGFIKDQLPYPNQDQHPKPQSDTSSILQSFTSGLKGHERSQHLQNKDREPKFVTWVYQRPVTISKSRSRCQTPVRHLQHPLQPKIRTPSTWMIFIPSKSRKKVKIWSMGSIKHQWPYPNQDQNYKPQSGTSSIPQISKSGLKGYGCSHCLQNKDREPELQILMY